MVRELPFCTSMMNRFKKTCTLQWLAEAVSQFYQAHLGRLIRENDKLWGDFCRKEFDADGNEVGLELNTFGYDKMSQFP